MNDADNIRLIHRVLSVTFNMEDVVQFHPRDDGTVVPYVRCNDVFGWACSDSEDVTLGNIDLFAQTIKDVQAITSSILENVRIESDIATLFACRCRQQRPFMHKGVYGTSLHITPLIEQLPAAPTCTVKPKELP